MKTQIKTYSIDLALNELTLLDGKVSDKAQIIIDKAKQESSYGFELPIMNEILRKAEEKGELTWRFKQINSCNYCDKPRTYHTYPRNTKYHNKGDYNYDEPFYYAGIAFNEGFITMQGRGDMCVDCEKKYNVIHRLIDYILDNDLKIEIQKNNYKPSKYIKDEIKICYDCGKEMRESEMGSLSTLMGNGYYKGICPHCGAKQLPFGQSHKLTDKFTFTRNPWFVDEVQLIKKIVDKYNEETEEDKVTLYVNSNQANKFIIEKNKWTNGHDKLISFDINEKIYNVGYFIEGYNIVSEIAYILKNKGYVEKTERIN